MKKESIKKVTVGIVAGLVGLGMGIAGAAVAIEPDQVVVTKEVIKEVQMPGETVTEYVNVTQEVEVLIDNENMELVLNEIYDNNGDVAYLIDDLDDDEVNQIVDRIVFANDVKALAVAEIESEGVDELDKEVSDSNVSIDEDDVDRFKVYDDADEVTLENVDYEDGDATVYVEAKFEQDEVVFDAVFKVKVRDNEVDGVSVESVIERV